MGKQLQAVLQVSALLYDKLKTIPEDDIREDFIQEIEEILEERDVLTKQLLEAGFIFDRNNKMHSMLFELDKGIKERLNLVLVGIKKDMKDLQTSKKSEKQYMNPYGHVQSMDGMYYDKKK